MYVCYNNKVICCFNKHNLDSKRNAYSYYTYKQESLYKLDKVYCKMFEYLILKFVF